MPSPVKSAQSTKEYLLTDYHAPELHAQHSTTFDGMHCASLANQEKSSPPMENHACSNHAKTPKSDSTTELVVSAHHTPRSKLMVTAVLMFATSEKYCSQLVPANHVASTPDQMTPTDTAKEVSATLFKSLLKTVPVATAHKCKSQIMPRNHALLTPTQSQLPTQHQSWSRLTQQPVTIVDADAADANTAKSK